MPPTKRVKKVISLTSQSTDSRANQEITLSEPEIPSDMDERCVDFVKAFVGTIVKQGGDNPQLLSAQIDQKMAGDLLSFSLSRLPEGELKSLLTSDFEALSSFFHQHYTYSLHSIATSISSQPVKRADTPRPVKVRPSRYGASSSTPQLSIEESIFGTEALLESLPYQLLATDGADTFYDHFQRLSPSPSSSKSARHAPAAPLRRQQMLLSAELPHDARFGEALAHAQQRSVVAAFQDAAQSALHLSPASFVAILGECSQLIAQQPPVSSFQTDGARAQFVACCRKLLYAASLASSSSEVQKAVSEFLAVLIPLLATFDLGDTQSLFPSLLQLFRSNPALIPQDHASSSKFESHLFQIVKLSA